MVEVADAVDRRGAVKVADSSRTTGATSVADVATLPAIVPVRVAGDAKGLAAHDRAPASYVPVPVATAVPAAVTAVRARRERPSGALRPPAR